MPLYEYSCPHGHNFETLQSIARRAKAKCPKCGKAAKLQLSASAIKTTTVIGPVISLPGDQPTSHVSVGLGDG